jgi:ribosome-associated protein
MPKSPRKTTTRRKLEALNTPANGHAAPVKRRRPAAGKRSKPKRRESDLTKLVSGVLDELKAAQVIFLDVRHLTTVTDAMAIASGRSDRHVRAIASAVVEQCKAAGFRPLGVEGEKAGEWVLVDLGDLVVHVMLPRVREFYNLEKLWDISARDESVGRGAEA